MCHLQLYFLQPDSHYAVYVSSDSVSQATNGETKIDMFHLERHPKRKARNLETYSIPTVTKPMKWTQKKVHSYSRQCSHGSFHLFKSALHNELFVQHNAAADWI